MPLNTVNPMAQAKDPVCGMMVDAATAAGEAWYEGQKYYFCSEQCRKQFEQNPAKFATTPR